MMVRLKDKDVRNIIYPNEYMILTFNNMDHEEIFIEYIDRLLYYFKYILIKDILSFFNKDYNFKAANEYGWTEIEINSACRNALQYDEDGEIIWTLCKPYTFNTIKNLVGINSRYERY